jgi:hypothetical protein
MVVRLAALRTARALLPRNIIFLLLNKHHTRLGTHENPLLKTLLVREENRRLKRNWPIDLI